MSAGAGTTSDTVEVETFCDVADVSSSEYIGQQPFARFRNRVIRLKRSPSGAGDCSSDIREKPIALRRTSSYQIVHKSTHDYQGWISNEHV